MQKFEDRFNTKGTLLERFGEYAILQTYTQDGDGFDLYLYVVMENRKRPATIKEIQDNNFLAPLIASAREGIVGHCFRQKVVEGVATTPAVYYGSIEQPCSDLSVIVALDPCDPPEIYTSSDGTTTPVEYLLEYDSRSGFTWDGEDPTSIAVDGIDLIVGTADSGSIWLFRDCDPCFGTEEYGALLEVYYLPSICCSESEPT